MKKIHKVWFFSFLADAAIISLVILALWIQNKKVYEIIRKEHLLVKETKENLIVSLNGIRDLNVEIDYASKELKGIEQKIMLLDTDVNENFSLVKHVKNYLQKFLKDLNSLEPKIGQIIEFVSINAGFKYKMFKKNQKFDATAYGIDCDVAKGIFTAAGVEPGVGTVAVDSRYIPHGCVLRLIIPKELEKFGLSSGPYTFIALDSGGLVKGSNRIDVFLNVPCEVIMSFGNKQNKDKNYVCKIVGDIYKPMARF